MADLIAGPGVASPVEPGALAETLLVSVVAGSRRADLSLPAQVPLAELLPELARRLTVAASTRVALVGVDGRALSPEASLSDSDVPSGAVLSLIPAGSVSAPRVYDDLALALAEVVRERFQPWQESARRTALAAAASLLAGLVAMGLMRTDWLSPELPRLWVWQVGIGLVVAGSVGLLLPHRHSLTSVAPLVVGVVVTLLAGAHEWAGVSASGFVLVLTPALVVGVAALPRASLWLVGAAGGGGDPPPGPIDEDRLRSDVTAAHELMVAVIAAVGVLAMVAAPVATRAGPWGFLVMLSCAAALGLRSRAVGSLWQRSCLLLGGWGAAGLALATVVISSDSTDQILTVTLGAAALAIGLSLVALSESQPPILDRALELAESALYLCLPGAVVMSLGGFGSAARLLLGWWAG